VANLSRGEEVLVGSEVAIQPTADPSAVGHTARLARHPLRHRVEVAELVGIGVPDTFDDCELVRVPELLERREVWVETAVGVKWEGLIGSNRERPVLVPIETIVDRHDGVETVVAAVHADDEKDAVVRTDGAERPRRWVVPRKH
jgi:hypothetical protein